MVFRKENKVDAFQRQINALRQQLGTAEDEADEAGDPEAVERTRDDVGYAYGDFGAAVVSDESSAALDTVQTPSPATTPGVDAQTSVIAHDTVWKGDLQTDGTLHVHGRVEGTIRATQDVYVADEADVDATITAANVVVAGLVKGTIRCGVRFEVLPQGRVAGDVQAPTLVIHDGAAVTGQFRMTPAEEADTNGAPSAQRRAARTGA